MFSTSFLFLQPLKAILNYASNVEIKDNLTVNNVEDPFPPDDAPC